MSIRHMAAIWDDPYYTEKGKTKLLVALAIADNARGEDGRAWPSIEYIARKARSSVRGVQEAIRDLEKDGKLKVIPFAGQKGTNLYVVNIPPATVAPPRNEAADEAAAGCTQIISNHQEPRIKKEAVANSIPQRPSLSEAITYASTIGFVEPVGEAQRFIDWHEARGWMLGTTPVHNWRARFKLWKTESKMRPERSEPKPSNRPAECRP